MPNKAAERYAKEHNDYNSDAQEYLAKKLNVEIDPADRIERTEPKPPPKEKPKKRGRPPKNPDKRGRPYGQKAPGSQPNMSLSRQLAMLPGENTKVMNHALAMWEWTRPDMTDPSAVNQRVIDYFTLCAHDDMKPSVEGLAVAFCADRKQIHRWAYEEKNSIIAPEGKDIMRKAYQLLNAQTVDYLQNGKINPIAAIFLLKNNQGYSDQTEVVVKPDVSGLESKPEEIEQYLSTTADILPD